MEQLTDMDSKEWTQTPVTLKQYFHLTFSLFPKINSKLQGFFLQDETWTTYRRNYFKLVTHLQINAEISLPCNMEFEEIGPKTVVQFLFRVSARKQNGNGQVPLIQQSAKRDRGPDSIIDPQECFPTTREFDLKYKTTFQRLQFQSATANNGRRKAAQQFHCICIEAIAVCQDGTVILVAVSESPPLVVRGRAPGHYKSIDKKTVEGVEFEQVKLDSEIGLIGLSAEMK